MLEPTKQQELDAALAGWGESRAQALRSIASAIASNPDVETQEVLQRLFTDVETHKRTNKDAHLKIASKIASIPHLEIQEAVWRVHMKFVTSMKALENRVLNGEAESRPERYEKFRRIRSAFEEKCRRADGNDDLIGLGQLIVAHFDAIELLLQPPLDEGTATVALGLTAAEPLPGEAAFPRCWEILAYLLPQDARQRIYEPARAELLEDYLLSRHCRRGWWSRLAVNGVFLVRTLVLAGECGRVLLASGAVQFWLWFIGLVVAWMIRITQRPPE